jgi:tRNA (cmo5U34)-methyltransferase
MSERMDLFSDPHVVAKYAAGRPRFVPGDNGLQRMVTLLLSEHVSDVNRVLVIRAGGGLKLSAFSQAQPRRASA